MKRRNKSTFGFREFFCLGGRPILSCYQTTHGDKYMLCGRPIFTRPVDNYGLKIISENEAATRENIKKLKNIDMSGKRRKLLFIVDRLDAIGGVETRLYKLISFLEKTNIKPIILTEYNAFEKLKEFCNLHLQFKARNAFSSLLELVHYGKFDAIEFQFKNPQFFFDIGVSLDNLKAIARVGGCFHSRIKCVPSDFDSLDYQIVVSERLKNDFPNSEVIPNWVQEVDNTPPPSLIQKVKKLFSCPVSMQRNFQR